MKKLTVEQFLAQRRRLNRLGMLAFGGLAIVLVGMQIGMWFRVPLIGNPLYVKEALEADAIPLCNLQVMAGLAPLMFVVTMAALLLLCVAGVAFMSLERRYLHLLDARRPQAATNLGDRPGHPLP